MSVYVILTVFILILWFQNFLIYLLVVTVCSLQNVSHYITIQQLYTQITLVKALCLCILNGNCLKYWCCSVTVLFFLKKMFIDFHESIFLNLFYQKVSSKVGLSCCRFLPNWTLTFSNFLMKNINICLVDVSKWN